MSLVKRPNSRFWYVQFQFDHKTVIRSTRTTDRKIAEQVAAKIRAEIHSELVLGRRKPLTLREALSRFVDTKKGQPNHRNLVGHQRTILSVLSGSLPISRITPATLEQFKQLRTNQGVKSQTIKHGLNCLAAALRKALREGYHCADPIVPSIKVTNGRVRYLSIEEERRLLSELHPEREVRGLPPVERRSAERRRAMQDNYDLVVLLLDTGARYGEIANVRWDQIDFATKSIRLWRPKVQNESVIFMTERAAEVMERRLKTRSSEYLFCSKSGGPRGYSAIAIRKAMCRAGLSDCTIHTLRHTHASRLIQNGLNVYEVRAVLGHTDIRTTMRYAHLDQTVVTSRARDVINRVNDAGGC